MTIAIDFDGTIVEHRYPKIGKEIPFATDTIKRLIHDGHQIILWTVREGELLDEAVEWCHSHGITFYSVNKNYPEEKIDRKSGCCKKITADLFIDDHNIGGIPDWGTIYHLITQQEFSYHTNNYCLNKRVITRRKQSWWKTLFK